ncbi:Retrovirus-related polyprotein from transposon [Salix suchowensis]|nr:Retrovirus-related polyprotein from transposon [Salix suchowensis]
MLVPTKLNGTNNPSWSKSMFRALKTNNKISFINGSIKSPLETKNPIEYALNQCNNMILSWISLSIEPDQAKSVVHAKIAHQSIASLSQGTMTISTYFTNLKGLCDELETHQMLPTYNQMTTHNKQTKEDSMMQFLMALNNTYNGVHNNILMMTSLPNAREAYPLVIQDDTQQQMTSRPTENFSIAAVIQSRSKGNQCASLYATNVRNSFLSTSIAESSTTT